MVRSSRIPAPRGAGILARFLVISLMLGMTTWLAAPAMAQDDMPKLGIEPADSDAIFFTETLEPGTTKSLQVQLSNTGKYDVEIMTYAADVYSLINGGLGVELADEAVSGTTTWLDYPTQTMELPKGKGQILPFTITVPKDATPGEYVTSLVIQNAKPIEGTGDLTVNQILRQAIAVAITVPGERRPAFEIGAVSFQDNPLVDSILIEVRNTGNVHLKPLGTVRVLDGNGNAAIDVQVGMDSVYAGTATMLEIGLSQTLASGDYRASIELEDSETGVAAAVTDQKFAVANSAQASTNSSIATLDVAPVRASADAPVQFVNVTAAIDNPGAPIQGARVLLHVELNGQLVEDFPLTSGELIAAGRTEFQQRYLPPTGWLPGTYSFSVQIESTDPATGETTVLAASDVPATVEIT